MTTMIDDLSDTELKHELKVIILHEADKPLDPETVTDDEPLFGPKAPLELDSIDGLQISMALQMRFGVAINDSKEVRRVMQSVNSLAAFLRAA